MSENLWTGEVARPHPSPSAELEPWIEHHPSDATAAPDWDPENDPLGSIDGSGRHAVPTDPTEAASPTSSYGAYLTDPPYVVDEDLPAVTDGSSQLSVSPASGARPMSANAVAPTPLTGELWQPLDAGPREQVTCPECGSKQDVHLNRRDSVDFCQRCDFPLFWTPSRIGRDRDLGQRSEALRRLPGTVGRSTLASIACPHCAELNTVSAITCVRCGLSMQPVQAPPPLVVVAPAPPPPVVVEPKRGVPWWVWLLLALEAAAIVVVVILKVNGVV